MRSLVQNFLASKANPIGIDFGSDCLRLSQIKKENGQLKLLAAAERDLPPSARKDWPARFDFFVHAAKEMLGEDDFVGRQVILGLPASATYIAHVRLPKMEDKAIADSLAWEIRGKLPIDPAHAVLRHLIAGEVFVEQEQREEIIVMACRRDVVEGLLASAEKARLDVIGMNVEIGAIVNCFSQVHRRKADAEATSCFVDVGFSATRVIVARGAQMLFARAIPIGTTHLNSVLADQLGITIEEAANRRRRTASRAEESALVITNAGANIALAEERRQDLRDLDAGSPVGVGAEEPGGSASLIDRIVDELNLCRRYHEAIFSEFPVDRLIFVGGGANDRQLCQEIARGVGLPAQVGDPLTRVEGRGRLDGQNKRPQPAWAVSVGLSAGGAV